MLTTRLLQRFSCTRLLPTRSQRYHDVNSEEFDREFADIKIEDFESFYVEKPENKSKIETILNEYEFVKYNSLGRVPSNISVKDMTILLTEGHSTQTRERLFHYLFKREMDKRATKLRSIKKKAETQIRRESKLLEFASRNSDRSGLLDGNGNLIYGLWHNSLFCRLSENNLKSGSSTTRLIAAAMFGRKLIFDFSYDEYMSRHTIQNSAEQVQVAYGLNRFMYKDPFDIWFCNFNRFNGSGKYLYENGMPNLYTGSMITTKEDCFTNHFDKSRLIYLSPNAREPLGKIHKTDDIYIIGVFNDKSNQQPVSYRKAVKLGIRTRSLPLDDNVAWRGASKSLCINHVTGILLEALANKSDWRAAFHKHIPSRKIKTMTQVIEEEQAKMGRFKKKFIADIFNLRKDNE